MAERRIPQRSLPDKPNAEYLRKEAKRLARGESMRLATAQRQLAHQYGRRNWAELLSTVQSMAFADGNGGGQGSAPSPGLPPAPESIPNLLPFLALRGLVVFPHGTHPIFVGRPMSINAVLYAQEHKLPILLVTQRDPVISDPSSSDMYELGTVARLLQTIRLSDGTIKATIEGKKRARVTRFIFNEDFSKAEVEEMREPADSDARLESVARSVVVEFARKRLNTLVDALSKRETLSAWPINRDGASTLADRIATALEMEIASKQALLEITDPLHRLEKLLTYLKALSALD